jgi:hypothetical protein
MLLMRANLESRRMEQRPIVASGTEIDRTDILWQMNWSGMYGWEDEAYVLSGSVAGAATALMPLLISVPVWGGTPLGSTGAAAGSS